MPERPMQPGFPAQMEFPKLPSGTWMMTAGWVSWMNATSAWWQWLAKNAHEQAEASAQYAEMLKDCNSLSVLDATSVYLSRSATMATRYAANNAELCAHLVETPTTTAPPQSPSSTIRNAA